MEGGTLPWRINKAEKDVFPDLDSYGKSLPPPPVGYFWSKKIDNSWELLQMKKSSIISNSNQSQNSLKDENIVEIKKVEPEKTPSSVLIHTIMPTDTLQGISLHYKVSITNIRRVNNFSGNSIQFMKTLKIPIESYESAPIQQDTPEVLTQKFKNMTNEGILESKVYLEENNWDLEKAFTQWKSDSNWEFNSKSKLNTKEIIINEKEEIENDIEVKPVEIQIFSNEITPICVQLEPPIPHYNNTEHEAVLEPLLG